MSVKCKVIGSQVLVPKILTTMKKNGDLSPYTAMTSASSIGMHHEDLL